MLWGLFIVSAHVPINFGTLRGIFGNHCFWCNRYSIHFIVHIPYSYCSTTHKKLFECTLSIRIQCGVDIAHCKRGQRGSGCFKHFSLSACEREQRGFWLLLKETYTASANQINKKRSWIQNLRPSNTSSTIIWMEIPVIYLNQYSHHLF